MEDCYALAFNAGLQPRIVDSTELRVSVQEAAGQFLVDDQLAADAIALVAARTTLGADIIPPLLEREVG